MGTTFRAKYTNGILKPLEELNFKEGEEVLLRIDPLPAVISEPSDSTGDAIRATAGGWVGLIDCEEFKRVIYESRERGSRTPPRL